MFQRKLLKNHLIASVLALCMLTGSPYAINAASAPQTQPVPAQESPVYLITPQTHKQSAQSIQITWDSSKDAYVKYYYVLRRNMKNSIGKGAWRTIAQIASDGKNGGPSYSYTDQLPKSAPQQYEYKICLLSKDKTTDTRGADYEAMTNDTAVPGSNIKVCIDPGHYGTLTNNYEATGADGNFPYSEAIFNLEVAKALQTELKQAYGIDSYLTRASASIELTYKGSTYKNENLDAKNIAIRGYAAKQQNCDLFLSLHTNSTSRQTKIWSQPKSINKVFVFVNQTAHMSDQGMKIANAIGLSLTEYNKESGIQTAGFTTRTKNKAAKFSSANNDSSKTKGTVIHRKGSSGSDYYGVLRGAAADGIPGILVEHAFHATQIVRKRAGSSFDLSENWAACDAYGIALGLGFLK